MEEKARFVEAVNSILVDCGEGRYDYLMERPYVYNREPGYEYITQSGRDVACVTGDSLPSIMRRIAEDLCL